LTSLALANFYSGHDEFNKLKRVNFIAIIFGVVLASGSKENGLVMLIPLACVSINKWRNLKESKTIMYLLFVGLTVPASVILNAVLYYFKNGQSYGGRTINLLSVWTSLFNNFDMHFIVIIISGLFYYLLWHSTRTKNNKIGFILVVFYSLLYLSESVFYLDATGPARYRILSDLAFAVVVGLTLFQMFLYFLDKIKVAVIGLKLSFIILVFALLAIESPIQNLRNQHVQSMNTLQLSYDWKEKIDDLTALVVRNPTRPILIHGFDSAVDLEMTVSLVRFLRFKDVESLIYLQMHEPANDWDALLKTLNEYSRYGNLDLGISPLAQISKTDKSLCIAFGTNLGDPNLLISGQIANSCEITRTL
jgi:hypothetical protein